MFTDDIGQFMEMFTLTGILVSGIIFARLAVKAKSIGSFRFQLSFFMLVWVAAEIPHVAQTLGWIPVESFDDIGLAIHMTSMALFAIFIGMRSFQFLKTGALPPPPALSTIPPNTTRPRGTLET
jgi:hypothetical protein